MYHQDEYSLLMDYRLNELPAVLERGRRYALLREAGLLRRHSLSRRVCHSLWHLGHTLVTTGQWLERRYEHAAPNPA